MKFEIYKKGVYVQGTKRNLVVLYEDSWDDFGYKTCFNTAYYDEKGLLVELGYMGIGFKNMEEGKVIQFIPTSFSTLPDGFFSLGNSEKYYQNVSSLGKSVAEDIFISLKDMAYDLSIFETYKDEAVVKSSFLRGRTVYTVQSQLNRISRGGLILTPFNFRYISPDQSSQNLYSKITLDFNIAPDSFPPTNIHVLIGRNGMGKTSLLKNMIGSLQTNNNDYGSFIDLNDSFNTKDTGTELFANILCVAFSPFDDFSKLTSKGSIPFSYIGLNKESGDLLNSVSTQFIENFENCMISNNKRDRWLVTVNILKSDPGFDESNVNKYINIWFDDRTIDKVSARKKIIEIFSNLSSGHKIILLIITACVDRLEEKSIVFLDEPENHLHPPLLSAFIRSLSYLLINRNGVSIISTHSPVVLQEVPKSCVWTLRKVNTIMKAERLETETFGTSIGSLTSEIFGLEVTESGFHKMIRDIVFDEKNLNYHEIINKFDYQLGNEALAILRTLLALRDNGRHIN